MLDKAPTYKIRQVIDITGASEFLIRTWELRYNALRPERTKTGRRLYTEADILKIRALLTLTNQGHRVGEIAKKSLPELESLLNENTLPITHSSKIQDIGSVLSAAKAFRWDEARQLILNKAKKSNPTKWIHELIVPLLVEIGQQVNKGQLSIAEEHILSAIIKECIASAFKLKKPKKSKMRLVFAAPEGDYHDIGIIVASRIANYLGANTLFLGPHMPKNELAAICVRYKATHLLLSSTTDLKSGAKDDFFSYVNFLDRNLGPKVTLWLAGPNTTQYKIALKRSYKIITSFFDFESEVKKCLA